MIPSVESRMIASTGKMIAAIAIANEGKDAAESLYLDTEAPAAGLETCEKGGTGRQGRKAIVAFACSLNAPLINRTALIGQAPIKKIIDGFGFTMPPAAMSGGTPPSTAVVLGQIAGAPRRVHHMSATILAALIGRGTKPVKMPSLIRTYDYTFKGDAEIGVAQRQQPPLLPSLLIKRGAAPLLKTLLEAPLCYQSGGAVLWHAEIIQPLVRGAANRYAAAFCQNRHPGFERSERDGRCLDQRRTAVQQRRGVFLCRRCWHRVGQPAVGDEPAFGANRSATARRLLQDLKEHAKVNPRRDLLPVAKPIARLPRATPVADAYVPSPGRNQRLHLQPRRLAANFCGR